MKTGWVGMILASALVLSACGSKSGQQAAESVTSEEKAVSFSGTGTIENTVLVDEGEQLRFHLQ